MAEKSNEELIEDLIDAVIYREENSGNVYSQVAERQKEEARAAVLARTCGPGEVVVPKEPDKKMIRAGVRVDSIDPETIYTAMLAARPRATSSDSENGRRNCNRLSDGGRKLPPKENRNDE